MDGVQVIVADNDSKDDSMEMMQREFPEVPLIRLEKNWGFAKGYNMALREVDAEYYILLNSDVEVSQDWLLPLVSYMDVHPEIAACQPKLLDFKDPEKFEYAGGAGGYMDKWTFTSSDGRFEMEFEPVLDRAACLDYKVIVSDQHQVFGRMSGKAILDDDTEVCIKDVLCFAEKVHNKY